MKKILFLGDSISISYRSRIEQYLNGRFDVRYPSENGKFAAYTYRMLLEWEREIGPYSDFDLVYWNNGLWDVARIYEEDLEFP